MWLLKLSSKSQKSCLAKICSCWSLRRVRHSGCLGHGSSIGQVAHMLQDGQAGGHPHGLPANVRSVYKCSLEVLLGTTIILSCLLGAAGGWGRCMSPEVLPLHLAREMYSAGKEKQALCPALVSSVFLLVLCNATLHIALQECPGWGSRSC